MAGTEKADNPVSRMAEITEEEERQRREELLAQSRQLARNSRGDFVSGAKAGRADRARAKLELVDSVPGANKGMSDADILKMGDSQKRSGPLTFWPDNPASKPNAFTGTPGRGVVKDARGFIDPLATLDTRPTSRSVAGVQLDQTRDKLRAERSVRGLSNNPRLMDQESIKAAANNAILAQKASATKASEVSYQAPKSTLARVSEIAPNLRAGEYIGVKEGKMGRDTLTEARYGGGVKSSVSNEVPAPGLVKDDKGKWVPIVAETKRIGKPFADAIDRRAKAEADTGAYIQSLADNDPAVQTARRIANDRLAKANASQAREKAAVNARRVLASEASPLHAPSRSQIEADNKVLATESAYSTPPKAVAATRAESSAYVLQVQKARKKALEAQQRLVATR